MTKIEDKTPVELEKLAADLSVAFTAGKAETYAELRQRLTAEFGALMGHTPMAAVNVLWDLADEAPTSGVLQIQIAKLLHDEAAVYRSDVGRKLDLAALTAE